MRYLIDTNIFVFLALDAEMLSRDTAAIIQEPDTVLCISTESVRELITGYRSKGLGSKRWKSAEEIINAITEHLPLISSDTRFGYYRPQGLDFIHNQR